MNKNCLSSNNIFRETETKDTIYLFPYKTTYLIDIELQME